MAITVSVAWCIFKDNVVNWVVAEMEIFFFCMSALGCTVNGSLLVWHGCVPDVVGGNKTHCSVVQLSEVTNPYTT